MTQIRIKEWWHPEAERRFGNGSGESFTEIEAALKSVVPAGEKAPSRSKIYRHLAPLTDPASKSSPSPPPSAPDAAPTPPPKPIELPAAVLNPDRTPVSRESLADDLSYLFNQQKALVQALTEKQDLVGAQRALRISTSLAALLQKQQAREAEDGEFVRVRETDITAAAERARSKLHDLVSRLAAERGR